MQDMLAGLSDFEKQKREVYVHTNMASDAMDAANKRNLLEMAEVEMVGTTVIRFFQINRTLICDGCIDVCNWSG